MRSNGLLRLTLGKPTGYQRSKARYKPGKIGHSENADVVIRVWELVDVHKSLLSPPGGYSPNPKLAGKPYSYVECRKSRGYTQQLRKTHNDRTNDPPIPVARGLESDLILNNCLHTGLKRTKILPTTN